jgi:hypothetical protein
MGVLGEGEEQLWVLIPKKFLTFFLRLHGQGYKCQRLARGLFSDHWRVVRLMDKRPLAPIGQSPMRENLEFQVYRNPGFSLVPS